MIYSVNNNTSILEGYIDDGFVIHEEEKKSLDLVSVDKVPEDYKNCVIKLMDTIEKETGKKVGSGTADAAFGSIKISLGNAKERVRKSDIRNMYNIIIPTKNLKNLQDKSLSGDDFIEKAAKSDGFVKGGKMLDPWKGYYYKKGKNSIYVLGWIHSIGQIQIHTICIEDSKDNLSFIKKNHNVVNESSVSSEDLGHEKEDLVPNKTGFEGMTIEDYYGFTNNLGAARSEELESDPVYGDFFRNPIAMSAFTEHLDLTDKNTRKVVMSMNEAEQASTLTSLTSKLYDNIVSKVDDIDYGDIPATKGDITKLPSYDKIVECVELLRGILKEYKQDTAPIDVISVAIANISSRKELFGRAFKLDVELPIIMYNNMVLSIVNAVSYMIATSIEFIKTPNQDSFQITLDRVAYAKTKNNLLYTNLKKFNKSCEKGEFDKAMNYIIQGRVNKAMKESAVTGIGIAIGTLAIILNIIPILREIVFFFYYTRMRVSEFFDIQADLLQMNSYNVEHNDNIDSDKRKHIVSKQLKIVEMFRKISNKIAFTNKKAEVEATKEITSSSKKMKLNNSNNDLSDNTSALF